MVTPVTGDGWTAEGCGEEKGREEMDESRGEGKGQGVMERDRRRERIRERRDPSCSKEREQEVWEEIVSNRAYSRRDSLSSYY